MITVSDIGLMDDSLVIWKFIRIIDIFCKKVGQKAIMMIVGINDGNERVSEFLLFGLTHKYEVGYCGQRIVLSDDIDEAFLQMKNIITEYTLDNI